MDKTIKKRIDSSEYRYALSGDGYEDCTIISITAEDKGNGYILTIRDK